MCLIKPRSNSASWSSSTAANLPVPGSGLPFLLTQGAFLLIREKHSGCMYPSFWQKRHLAADLSPLLLPLPPFPLEPAKWLGRRKGCLPDLALFKLIALILTLSRSSISTSSCHPSRQGCLFLFLAAQFVFRPTPSPWPLEWPHWAWLDNAAKASSW